MNILPTMDSFSYKVQIFYNMLIEHISEIMLAENGVKVKLYFDAKDVRYAIFGIHYLYNGQKFNSKHFKAESSIIQTLGFGGWLGQMHLLQPHLSELLAGLRDPHNFIPNNWNQFVHEFIHEISFHKEIPPMDKMNAENLVEHVKKYSGSTYEAFKVLQYVLYAKDWRRRLKKMKDENIVVLSGENLIEAELLARDEFRQFKEILDARRPNTTINNFADALALTILLEKTKLRNSNVPDSPLCLYYDTVSSPDGAPLFDAVIKEAQLTDQFTYWMQNRPYSIFKPAAYFEFRAMFRSPKSKPLDSELRNTTKVRWTKEQLIKLRDEIGEILKAKKEISEDIQLNVFNSSLGDLVQNIENFSFFTEIWERELAQEEAQQIIADLKLLDELRLNQLITPRFIQGVHEALDDTLEELERNTIDHRWISQLWNRLEERTQNLPEINFIDDFRLSRFSFPENILETVDSTLNGLIQKEEEKREKTFRLIVRACFNLRYSKNNADTYENDLAIVSALLWLVDMHDELIEILNKHKPLPHYSFKIIHTASILQSSMFTRVIFTQRVNDIERDYNFAKDKNQKIDQAELAIGLAYLHFHLWIKLGFWAQWRSKQLFNPTQAEEAQAIIETAVHFSHIAYEILKEINPPKALYALNQQLFYLVEGGNEIQIKKIVELKRDFVGYQHRNPKLWQYTYDDTLAHYSHRRAVTTKDPKKKSEFLNEALHFSRRAIEACKGKDEQVVYYLQVIKSEVEMLEIEQTSQHVDKP